MKSNADVISKVIDFIEEHLTDDLYLEKIADSAFYSKYHFHRMFVDIVGCTLHQYVQRRRLSEAAWQLIYTDKLIIDIAFIAGYETQQSFTLAFKKLYGKSPQVYRKKKEYQSIQLKFEKHRVEYNSYTKFNMRCGGKVA